MKNFHPVDRNEVAELMVRAEAADQADLPDGLSIPDELLGPGRESPIVSPPDGTP